jgi:type IV secretory pathway TrbD component
MPVDMPSLRPLLAVLLLALALLPARAADVVYPPGSRIGLAPPPGLATSKTFFGYEDPDNNVAMMLVALPVQAYADLDRAMNAEALKRQGVTFETREPLALASGQAFLVVGRQEVEKTQVTKWFLVASSPTLTALVTMQVPDAAKALYPDAAIRAALTTLAIRPAVPIEEQLGLVPFKVDELAGFRIAGVIPGRAVMLSDAPADRAGPPEAATEPHIFVAVAPGGPAQSSERDNFARELFAAFPNLKDIRIVSSEPLRMGGQQGHQILANAKDAAGAATLTVVQWLRFGGGVYMQMVGIARTDAWKDAYPRFRSVRDGIEPR